jgi:hypothetical protein
MSNWTTGVPQKKPVLQQEETTQVAQAKVVQHHYVRAQIHTIEANAEPLIGETLNALRGRPNFGNLSDNHLNLAYQRMTTSLQKAEICINFKASKWFMEPNNYDSYTQMYERGVRNINAPGEKPNPEMRLADNEINNAKMRVLADDMVTFPPHMRAGGNNMYQPIDRKFGGIGRVMVPGTMEKVEGRDEYRSTNPHFNPKAKQVFAALNYGRRPHGASTGYRNSRLVLEPKLMTNMIFFACDTFYYRTENVSAEHQICFSLLGAIYGKASPTLREELFKACLGNLLLPDTADSHLLVEGHLFEPLTFAGNIQAMYVSRLDEKTSAPLANGPWATIKANATKFLEKFISGRPQKAFMDT